jgi:calreticulin
MRLLLVGLLVVQFVVGTIYFEDRFTDDQFEDRWVDSTWKGADRGKWIQTAGKFFGHENESKGIQTSQDARFYAISSKFDKPFSNEGKDLVLQFTVKHEQNIDCGGGYIKLLPAGFDQKNFGGDSPYYLMFGPDICGPGTRKTHAIITYHEKNHLIKREVPCESDTLTHLYTWIIHPDNTYEIKIDGVSKQTGTLEADWDLLEPKEIKDPEASKPSDWVDDAKIDDPTDEKPAGWDDIPKTIVDPEADQPEDWDTELDGEWEAPQIDNPEYKGEWRAKKIDNPAYKGPWVHPMVPNPAYKPDDSLYVFENIGGVGIEIWQVKAGSIFDNILVTDNEDEADKHATEYYTSLKDLEKQAFDRLEAERKAAEDKAREEAAKKAEEDKDDDDEDEDEDETDADEDEDDEDDDEHDHDHEDL